LTPNLPPDPIAPASRLIPLRATVSSRYPTGAATLNTTLVAITFDSMPAPTYKELSKCGEFLLLSVLHMIDALRYNRKTTTDTITITYVIEADDKLANIEHLIS